MASATWGESEVGGAVQVGDGAGDLQDAGIGPGAEAQALHRDLQEPPGLRPQGAVEKSTRY